MSDDKSEFLSPEARRTIDIAQKLDAGVCDSIAGKVIFSELCDEVDNLLDTLQFGGHITADDRKNGIKEIKGNSR